MELAVQIKMNEKLFLRNPELSELGRNIIKYSVVMIREKGFEDFTFKKLALRIGTTEASIYRYFENKHRLLIYIVAWYWSYLEYKVVFYTQNLVTPEIKLQKIIELLAKPVTDDFSTDYIDEKLVYEVAVWEGSKAYLTKHVSKDNRDRLFKPYKDLCGRIARIMSEYNPRYKYPRSLSSTLLEMAHYQRFFMNNLPSLTDFGEDKSEERLYHFLYQLVFDSLKK
jgi:AcrR family transcriptional regulator